MSINLTNQQEDEKQQGYGNYGQTRTLYDHSSDMETTKFLLNVKDEMDNKIQHYRGYFYDSTVQKWIRIYPESDCIINNIGVDFVQRQFSHLTNKVCALANLSKENVANFIMEYSSRMRRLLIRNRKHFAIINSSAMDEIKNDITEIGYFVLTRGKGDKEREFIHKGTQRVEHTSYNEAPSGKKMKIGF